MGFYVGAKVVLFNLVKYGLLMTFPGLKPSLWAVLTRLCLSSLLGLCQLGL